MCNRNISEPLRTLMRIWQVGNFLKYKSFKTVSEACGEEDTLVVYFTHNSVLGYQTNSFVANGTHGCKEKRENKI